MYQGEGEGGWSTGLGNIPKKYHFFMNSLNRVYSDVLSIVRGKNTKLRFEIPRKLSKHLLKRCCFDHNDDDYDRHYPSSRITRSMEKAQARLSIVVS